MTSDADYKAFLEGKRDVAVPAGVSVQEGDVNPVLYPFQRKLVEWALRKGRAALWADCGLGKTFMQLEWARLTGERSLIVAPLTVAHQTVSEARTIGLEVQYARSQAEAGDLTITNYEMIDHFDPSEFGAVVLDESSILKSFGGKTRTKLIEMFGATRLKLCCTATPAPNDISEFANHAEFLGICTREEMLSQFFVHDDDGWRLKGYAVEAFHRWMASWGMMLKTPSDIGYSDDGYLLPPLDVVTTLIEGDGLEFARAQGQLFPTGIGGVQGRSAARKLTLDSKVAEATTILNASREQWIVWVGLNDEGRNLHRNVPDSVLVEGADSVSDKVDRVTRFLSGDARVLITKVSIAGFGLNLQRCHNVMFVGLSDSYEQWYQAIRRCWRFGQKSPVHVNVVISDLESPILENVMQKERQAEVTSQQMVLNVAEYERQELGQAPMRTNGYHHDTREGDHWTMLLGDCVERMREIPDAHVDMSIFSPPFLSLYVYSPSERDMGNSRTEKEFFDHYGYVVNELRRITKPGRLVACHVAQVPTTLVKDGVIGLRDFRGKVIEAFIDAGMIYHGEVVIDKDPQAQAIRTKAKSLLFVQLKKDSSWLRPGLADYILVFRNPGENKEVIHPDIDNNTWIEWARPIWYNIRESDTLNVAEARSEKDERHIAPLQLETIERCVRLWSNKGELVFSPFAGIGSEGYQSILLERQFLGIELKQEYYDVACRNLRRANERASQMRMV